MRLTETDTSAFMLPEGRPGLWGTQLGEKKGIEDELTCSPSSFCQ